jgi:hypothetical protein
MVLAGTYSPTFDHPLHLEHTNDFISDSVEERRNTDYVGITVLLFTYTDIQREDLHHERQSAPAGVIPQAIYSRHRSSR